MQRTITIAGLKAINYWLHSFVEMTNEEKVDAFLDDAGKQLGRRALTRWKHTNNFLPVSITITYEDKDIDNKPLG